MNVGELDHFSLGQWEQWELRPHYRLSSTILEVCSFKSSVEYGDDIVLSASHSTTRQPSPR